MAERLVHDETPMEYFKQLVEGALAHQRVQSSEHTTFYVVNLLAAFVCPQRETADALQEPLALRLARALQTGGVQQREGLRQVGDVSLFLAGILRRQPRPQARRRRLLRHARRLRLRAPESAGR